MPDIGFIRPKRIGGDFGILRIKSFLTLYSDPL
jgi:hypothetical protein